MIYIEFKSYPLLMNNPSPLFYAARKQYQKVRFLPNLMFLYTICEVQSLNVLTTFSHLLTYLLPPWP